MREYIRLLNLNKHLNKHLQSSWNLYGKEKFCIEVLELIDINLGNTYLRERETFWIISKETYKENLGYNIIPGGIGTLGQACSEEKKFKISQSNLGKVAWNRGKSPSKEQIDKHKLSVRNKGKKIDIYDNFGNFIETIQSQISVIEKYHSAKNTILNSYKNTEEFLWRPNNKYIFRYHGDPLNVKFLSLINSNGKEVLKTLKINELFSYLRLQGISIPKLFERKLRMSYNNSSKEFTEIINKYSVNCKIARNNSNVIDESRQPKNRGSINGANGKS